MQEYLTVTALTKYLKRKFEADPHLGRVYLTGEISNYRMRANAHQYFSLKDEKAKIAAIMFRGAFEKLAFTPKEGMKVLVVGRISLYEASGNYQMYIEHMEPDGVGALYQALAERQEKLAKEGLFALPKKPLVRFPKRIAVLTSPSGAVVQDIRTTIKRRYPIVEVVVYPTLVQGQQAADDIVANLRRVAEQGDFDTVILARGGGSIEDLWPFNEERVARAIVALELPVISSVGHETDVTIADLVADVRAATPTAAAELATPVLQEEILRLQEYQVRLSQRMEQRLAQEKQRLTRLQQSYIFQQPQRLYEGFMLKLDQIKQDLEHEMTETIRSKKEQWNQTAHRLSLVNPTHRLAQEQGQLNYLRERLEKAVWEQQREQRRRFQKQVEALDLLSPLSTMARGYSITRKDAQIVRSVRQVSVGDQIMVTLGDGQLKAEVQESHRVEEETRNADEKESNI